MESGEQGLPSAISAAPTTGIPTESPPPLGDPINGPDPAAEPEFHALISDEEHEHDHDHDHDHEHDHDSDHDHEHDQHDDDQGHDHVVGTVASLDDIKLKIIKQVINTSSRFLLFSSKWFFSLIGDILSCEVELSHRRSQNWIDKPSEFSFVSLEAFRNWNLMCLLENLETLCFHIPGFLFIFVSALISFALSGCWFVHMT